MNLNLTNYFDNDTKENKLMENLIKSLSDYLDKNQKQQLDELPLIEKILTERNVSTGNENAIRSKETETVINFAKKMNNNEPFYFVKDNKKIFWKNNERHIDNSMFTVWKLSNDKLEKIYFSKEELPNTLKVNDVFRIKDNEYIVDDLLTKDLKNEIINMTNEILDRQDERLNGYRKEGHSYMITDKQNGKVFLRDLTENSNIEFEEVSLSKELIDQISQGTILKYSNGNYECLKKD